VNLKISVVFGLLIFLFWITLGCAINFSQPAQGDLLFADDFSGKNISWKTWVDETRSAASLNDGKLVMILEQGNTDIFSTNHIIHPDIEIRATASKEHGTNDNIIGLFCRYSDEKNYYSFLISSDGYYGITRMLDGTLTMISGDQMQYTEVVNQGDATNVLTAICDGNTLEFIVNGETLASVHDSSFRDGRNGVMIGTFSDPGYLVVMFDDFSIRAR
jgi:hypothetical protein